MKVRITCPDCDSETFKVVRIDGERLVLHCYDCPRELHVRPTPVKLDVE